MTDRDSSLSELEQRIGHRFRRPELLRKAITHKSFTHESEEDPSFHNENLEFLGDSILGFVVTDLICAAFPAATEGRLSKIKAHLVSATMLADLAQRLQLPEHFRLGKGEEKTGGRKKKALAANAFEAVVAAVYLDAGMRAVRRFLVAIYEPLLQEIQEGRAMVEDPKTTLQEYLQARNLSPACYVVTAESGPQHRKTFQVELTVGDRRLAQANGTTKKKAESLAAEAALKTLLGNGGLRQSSR